MYQHKEIISGLKGLVAFYPANDPRYPKIDATLRTSTYGLYVDHPLCTVENLYNAAPEFKSFTYPDWVSGSDYTIHEVVTESGSTYAAKSNLTNNTTAPSADTTNWQKIDPFSAWLAQQYDEAAINLVNDFVTRKKYERIGKSLLDMQELYRGAGMISNTVVKESRFVGFQIDFTNSHGLMLRIDKLGFQSSATGEVTFYLYNTSQVEAIGEYTVTLDTANNFEWFDLTEAIIGYMRDNNDASSSYYFGYYEDDLTNGQAIRKEFDISAAPCGSCSSTNTDLYNAWSAYTAIRAIYVENSYLDDGRELFDLNGVKPHDNTNWGMNLKISVLCDITPMLLENKSLFAPLLSKRVSLELLDKIAFTTRMNTIADKTRRLAMADLDDNPKSGSYLAKYYKELDAMVVDFSGFNSACLPREDKHRRIKFSAV